MWAGFSTFLFWTYGYDHFEPRYWVLVFLPFVIALLIPLLKKEWMPIALMLIWVSFLPNFLRDASWLKSWSDQEMSVARNWQDSASRFCGRYTVAVPWGYYAYGTYRYFMHMKCPDLRTTFFTSPTDDPSTLHWISKEPVLQLSEKILRHGGDAGVYLKKEDRWVRIGQEKVQGPK